MFIISSKRVKMFQNLYHIYKMIIKTFGEHFSRYIKLSTDIKINCVKICFFVKIFILHDYFKMILGIFNFNFS